MNISKFILVIISVFVIGGLAVWYLSDIGAPADEVVQESTAQAPSTPGEPVVIISYTNEGYRPSNVNIKVGDTVRFTNNSEDQETWPASAVHPTHSVYPENTANDCLGSSFDACRGLKSGESWDFRFDRVGEWRFHDHIHASKTGVVNVSE